MKRLTPFAVAVLFLTSASGTALAKQDCQKKASADSSVPQHGCGEGSGPWSLAPEPGSSELTNKFLKGFSNPSPNEAAKRTFEPQKSNPNLMKY
jgi:hypothetical protein